MSASMRGSVGHDPREFHECLERWVGASLITQAEARSIERFESARAPATTRRPLAVEALAYLGGALALSAAVAAGAQVWDDLAPGVRVGLVASGSVVCLAAGWWLRESAEPAIDRLTGVLWGLAVVLAGLCGSLAAHDLMELRDEGPLAVGGATATALALALYASRRRTIQQLAVLGGLLVTLNQAVDPDASLAHGLLTAAVGATWALLGWREMLIPTRTALVAGSAVAMLGAMLPGDDERAIALVPAIVVAIALVAASVALRDGVVLGIGVVGLFRASVATITRFFSGSLAMPVALLIAGAVAFGAALVLARRASTAERRRGSPRARRPRGQDVPL